MFLNGLLESINSHALLLLSRQQRDDDSSCFTELYIRVADVLVGLADEASDNLAINDVLVTPGNLLHVVDHLVRLPCHVTHVHVELLLKEIHLFGPQFIESLDLCDVPRLLVGLHTHLVF